MYGAKSKYVRKYARKGRSKVGAMAKGKSTKIQSLAKAVSRIQRSMRTNVEYLNYGQQGYFAPTNTPDVLNLSAFSSFSDLFGSSSNDDVANKIVHKSFGIDMYLTLESTVNEPDTTMFTIFLVSLKDSIGPAFNSSTGALSLSNGQHYSIQGGMALLNKKCFTIHKTKRVVLSNHGTSLANPSAQTQGGTDWRHYWRIPVNKMITNPIGDWKALGTAQDPSKQYYLLVFSDNSGVDLQNPRFNYNIVHTMKTVA